MSKAFIFMSLQVILIVLYGCSPQEPNNLNSNLAQEPKESTNWVVTQEKVESPMFTCEQGVSTAGEIVDVTGSDHNLRQLPNKNAPKIINVKASEALHETHYHSIDSSTRVQIQCITDNWARIQITEPDWLTDVVGWTEKKNLLLPRSAEELRIYTENDIAWDNDTMPYKAMITKAVNKIHHEDPRCRERIDASTVSRSLNKSTKTETVFYVACGTGLSSVNVYFTIDDVESGKHFSAPGHIDHNKARLLCENYAKSKSTHPSTVDFSHIISMEIIEHPNGRTTINSTFTAKNSFNLELKFNIRCIFDENELLEAEISESAK